MAEKDKLNWTQEITDKILEVADGELSMPEIRRILQEEHGFSVSISALRRKMLKIGAPIRKHGYAPPVNDDMKDFVYAKTKEGLPITVIQKLFNERYDRHFTYSRIWRIAIDSGADVEQRLTAKTFTEDWLRLQAKFAPDGETCRKHWLWRWRRLDEQRTTRGVVFHGKKEPIPHLMNTQQFKDEWTAMQRLFGITS